RMRSVATLRGAGWLLTALLATGLAACFLDWAVHLPALIRALILVVTLAVAGVVGYIYLLCPLTARMDDLTLALQIEERYPSLNDALASTVQFLGQTGPDITGQSVGMRREAVRRAVARAEGVDFNRVVDDRGIRTAGLSGLAAAAAAIVL